MNRADFQRLALVRLSDVEVLLNAGNYDGAYYLCGYVIECALKACIAKQTQQYDFPDLQTVKSSYTHNLQQLIGTAGLQVQLQGEITNDPVFATNWGLVRDWKETSRYEINSQQTAQNLYDAVADPLHGVLQWLRQRW
jgi:HEPN domain-containing protein